MWYWRPPQIRYHQDTDEALAPPPTRMTAWHAVSFRTVRIDFNGSLLLSKCYTASAAYDYEVRCDACGHPKSGLIRTATRYRIVIKCVVRMSRVYFLLYYRYQLSWAISSGYCFYWRRYTHKGSEVLRSELYAHFVSHQTTYETVSSRQHV